MVRRDVLPQRPSVASPEDASPVAPVGEYPDAEADVRLDQARSQVLAFIHRIDAGNAPPEGAPTRNPAPSEASASASTPAGFRAPDGGVIRQSADILLPDVPTEPMADAAAASATESVEFVQTDASASEPSRKPRRFHDPPSSPLDKGGNLSPPKVVKVSIRRRDVGATQPARASQPEKPVAAKKLANVPTTTAEPVEPNAATAGLIEDLERRVAETPNDLESQWRLRLLRMGADDEADTFEDPPAGMVEESAALLSTATRMVAATQRALADPTTGTDAALAAVDAFRGVLRKRASLSIPTVALCSRVQAYGLYDVLPNGAFQPYTPNRAIVYVEVGSFSSEKAADGRYRTLLSERLEVLTPEGDVLWEHEESAIEDFSMRRREDFFIAQRASLPTAMKAGEYVLKVTVADLLADKWTQALHRFRVGESDEITP